jgi:PKD repeat protein/pimeloyl-ACP methyl ester carboxylesterase
LVEAEVTNIGNTTSGENYLFIYYSQDLSVTDNEIISRVSIKGLAPNESQEIDFLYPIPSTLAAGDYYIGFEIDPFDSVAESDEDNLFCASNGASCVTFNITNATLAFQKFTYPIIFIHGWTGDSRTWDDFTDEANSFYGWTYGGRLDYCLNPDDNQSTSDGYILSFVDISDIGVGDYYYVNFDVSTDGDLYVGNDGIPFNNDYSNQSAVVKQGWAVQDAVEKVLNVTDVDKVILVGHSMGGLASREYLQNPEIWQADGDHHVAKLLTIGSPNGGSNATGSNLGIFFGYDESSEAVRDLRYSSFLFEGQYLDGGLENSLSIFYNNDVNCNGFVGDNIIGLNEKTSPSDIDYSCIVGVGDNLPSGEGDGIVGAFRADLNNYLLAQPPLAPLHADRLDVTTGHTSIHKENNDIMIRSLDEPDFYDIAYPIPLNSLNYGFSTVQAINHPIPPPNNDIDWDDFRIDISENGLLEVAIWNIPVNAAALFLLDDNYNILEEVQSLGESNIDFSYQISPGTYYIEVGSIPTTNSWRFPYGYSVLFTSASGLVADFSSNIQEGCLPLTVNFTDESAGNPTTYSWAFQGGLPSTSTAQNPTVIYNEPGIYPVSLSVSNAAGTNSITQNGYITVKSIPDADFDFSIQENNTVVFSNQTNFDLEIPSYLWDFGDTQTSTEVSPTHTYQTDGVYAVKLTAVNSCGTSNTTQSVEIMTVSTNDLSIHSDIQVFPNPSKEYLNIIIEGDINGSYDIHLINAVGQLIIERKLNKFANIAKTQLDVVDLPSGAYMVRISSAKESCMKKIIKE